MMFYNYEAVDYLFNNSNGLFIKRIINKIKNDLLTFERRLQLIVECYSDPSDGSQRLELIINTPKNLAVNMYDIHRITHIYQKTLVELGCALDVFEGISFNEVLAYV